MKGASGWRDRGKGKIGNWGERQVRPGTGKRYCIIQSDSFLMNFQVAQTNLAQLATCIRYVCVCICVPVPNSCIPTAWLTQALIAYFPGESSRLNHSTFEYLVAPLFGSLSIKR